MVKPRMRRTWLLTTGFVLATGACSNLSKLDDFVFADVCVPESLETTCKGVECGPRTNNCGEPVECPDTCATKTDATESLPLTCGNNPDKDPNRCGCSTDPDQHQSCCLDESLEVTCKGVECGPRTNNCGKAVVCPDTCPLKGDGTQTCGDNSSQDPNACGCTDDASNPLKCCVPDPIEKVCFATQCGAKLDNCGVSRDCPDTCASPDTCGDNPTEDPNQCGCTSPPQEQICANVECGELIDKCGATVDCTDAKCAPLHHCGLGGAGKNECGCTGAPMNVPPAPEGCEQVFGTADFDNLDHVYYICHDASYPKARSFCQGFGTDLARPKSSLQLAFLHGELITSANAFSWLQRRQCWLGLEDPNCEYAPCDFTWIDGSPLDAPQWNFGEPNNDNGAEHCVELRYDFLRNEYGWNDIACLSKRGIVCETTCK